MWGRVKEEPGAFISLLIEKHQGVAGFTFPFEGRVTINSSRPTYAFTAIVLWRDLDFI